MRTQNNRINSNGTHEHTDRYDGWYDPLAFDEYIAHRIAYINCCNPASLMDNYFMSTDDNGLLRWKGFTHYNNTDTAYLLIKFA